MLLGWKVKLGDYRLAPKNIEAFSLDRKQHFRYYDRKLTESKTFIYYDVLFQTTD